MPAEELLADEQWRVDWSNVGIKTLEAFRHGSY